MTASSFIPTPVFRSDSSMMEEIGIAKEFLGISRDVAIAEVAEWSFARIALKGLK